MKERIILPRIIRVDLTIDNDRERLACRVKGCPYRTGPCTCGIFGELVGGWRHTKCIEAESRYLSEHYKNG